MAIEYAGLPARDHDALAGVSSSSEHDDTAVAAVEAEATLALAGSLAVSGAILPNQRWFALITLFG